MRNSLAETLSPARSIETRGCCFSSDNTLLLSVVSQCNQACLHCMRDAAIATPEAWPTAEFELQVAAAFAERRFSRVIFSGGEPTLLRNLPDLIEAAARHTRHVSLCTNASTIDRAMAAALRGAGLVKATVGLEGVGADYEVFRRAPGRFPAVMRGLCALREAGIRVTGNITLWNRIIMKGDEIAAALGTAGLENYTVSTPILNGRAAENRHLFDAVSQETATRFARSLQQAAGKPVNLRFPQCSSGRCHSGRGIFQLKRGGTLAHCPDFNRRVAVVDAG